MSVITFVCAGQMNSAITFPAFENGHEVRLVGSPLDRVIIDGLKKDNFHITLKRTLHDGIKYYQIEELEQALKGADLVLGGVSSFGLDWFCDEILPVLPEDVPVLTVTKGMVDLEDGTSREQRRRLLRYARENTKKKVKDEPVSLEEKKVLEDVLQEFFA